MAASLRWQVSRYRLRRALAGRLSDMRAEATHVADSRRRRHQKTEYIISSRFAFENLLFAVK